MYSIKPGRGPSFVGAIGGIIIVVFGIFWTIIAYKMTHSIMGTPNIVGIFFPLFGVIFVLLGIGSVIYNFVNATKQKRFSVLDITTAQEEPDPLNEYFGDKLQASENAESRLSELNQLKAKCLITEAEYNEQRRKILSAI